MPKRRRVIIESPYAGDVPGNTAYLKRCLRDSIARGEVPFASHGLYPNCLNDLLVSERIIGIKLGYEWWDVADAIVFYLDRGVSNGMYMALQRAEALGKTIETRRLDASCSSDG